MLTITAPGQGAQAPGFLSAWLELPGWADRLGAWSELAGCDLSRAGTTAGADEIRDTAVAQPLLVAAAVSTAELAAFAAVPPAGARLRPLAVAGAFHTRHMEPAVAELAAATAEMAVHDPALPLLSNRDGAAVASGADWIDRIVNQVS